MKKAVFSAAEARALIEAGAVRQVVALGQPGGWAVVLRVGMLDRPIGLKRGHAPRLFRSLNTVADELRRMGLTTFLVDATHLELSTLRLRLPRLEGAL